MKSVIPQEEEELSDREDESPARIKKALKEPETESQE